MNLRAFHNTVRKLYNIEWEQLGFLTDVQKDNFFENPPMFFIRADDETATKLWDVMHPPAPQPAAGELRGNVIYPREWITRTTDFEYDTGATCASGWNAALGRRHRPRQLAVATPRVATRNGRRTYAQVSV